MRGFTSRGYAGVVECGGGGDRGHGYLRTWGRGAVRTPRRSARATGLPRGPHRAARCRLDPGRGLEPPTHRPLERSARGDHRSRQFRGGRAPPSHGLASKRGSSARWSLGFSLPFVFLAVLSLAQRATPIGLQGRVSAVISLALFGPQAPMQAAGSLAIAHTSFRTIFLALAAAAGLIAVWLRRAGLMQTDPRPGQRRDVVGQTDHEDQQDQREPDQCRHAPSPRTESACP